MWKLYFGVTITKHGTRIAPFVSLKVNHSAKLVSFYKKKRFINCFSTQVSLWFLNVYKIAIKCKLAFTQADTETITINKNIVTVIYIYNEDLYNTSLCENKNVSYDSCEWLVYWNVNSDLKQFTMILLQKGKFCKTWSIICSTVHISVASIIFTKSSSL